jgi:rhodanese-related sulfurtransferase
VERDLDPRAAEALVRERAVLVDVREPQELEEDGRVPGATHIPFTTFTERAGELPEERALVVICRSGNRSAMVAEALRASGREAYNVAGGILAWEASGLSVQRNT